jgi:hypothetical protein
MESPPFQSLDVEDSQNTSSPTNVFDLCHHDLDPNILVDGNRNVIGIIDWDRLMTVDLNYTKKSVIYQAIVAVLYEDEDCLEVLRKSLAEIEEFRRVDLTEFCIRLATRWPAVQMTLTEKIAGLLDPSS